MALDERIKISDNEIKDRETAWSSWSSDEIDEYELLIGKLLKSKNMENILSQKKFEYPPLGRPFVAQKEKIRNVGKD